MTDTDTPLHLRARRLPGGEPVDVWVAGGRVAAGPVAGARTVADGGWVMPALVDCHVHLGAPEIGGPLDLDVLEDELARLAASGVGAARVLGSPEPLPTAALARPRGPLLQTAGVAVAAPGRFLPGWGRLAGPDELAAACVEESRFGWSKIIADWFDDAGGYGPAFPPEALAEAVAAVHAEGRRVAVHAQSADGARAAVAAGADTIEHGMHLPPELLPDLAARGGVLVPTGSVFELLAPSMTDDGVPELMRAWFADGLARHADLVRAAHEQGVTVLAGTDQPVGALVDEIVWLHRAGIPAEEAIGAASWTARGVLDLPRLRPGDRADLVWLEQDPREGLERLREPGLVVLGGAVVSVRQEPRPGS